MTENGEDKELLELLRALGGDCPSELIDLLDESQSKWRKGVIKEFISDHIWKKGVNKELAYLKRMVWAIFGVTLIATLSQYFIQYILPIIESMGG